jgi:hypothetical protein
MTERPTHCEECDEELHEYASEVHGVTGVSCDSCGWSWDDPPPAPSKPPKKNKKLLSKRGKEIREILICHGEMLLESGTIIQVGTIRDPKQKKAINEAARKLAGSFLGLMAGLLALDADVHADFAQAGFIADQGTIKGINKKLKKLKKGKTK